MTIMAPILAAQERPASASAWLTALITLAATCAALILILRREAVEVASIWWNSSTFNHCLLIVPILGWLVWQRREGLARLTPVPWWPGLVWLGGGALAWMLGEASGVSLLRHAALILVLQGAVIACLGLAVTRGLLFPLVYSLFLIPAGAELVPQMQVVTAELTMALLNASGIPAHLDGIFISTSIALFEVAEACAGVKFLVAMLAYGVLLSHLCFRSPWRRAVFIAVSVVVPILANGVRAWGTVYMAFRTSVEQAVGFDHIVYGWVFFALVMALVIGLGWPFFDRRVGEAWFDPGKLQPTSPKVPGKRFPEVAIAAIALAAAPALWLSAVAASATDVPSRLNWPSVPGYVRVDQGAGRTWQPTFAGADRIHLAHYRAAGETVIDLAVAVFARQERGRELVGAGQGAAGPGWARTGDLPPPPGGKAERLMGEEVVREALTFYRVGDRLTGSDFAVKLETIRARLLGGDQSAVAVIVSAQTPAAGASVRPALDRFVAALGGPAALADQAAGKR